MKTGTVNPQSKTAGALLPACMLLTCMLAGCSILGGGKKQASTIYAPDPRVQADPAWPSVSWQLSLVPPTSSRMVDSQRIAVRPTPGEIQVYKGAVWAKTPSEQVTDTVLRALEDSGKIPAVARQGSGVAADYKLVMDMRRFEADYAGAAVPSATIEVNAKLLHAPDQDIVASHTFLQVVPAAGTDVSSVAQAFDQALGAIGHDVAGWTLTSGHAHEHSGAHKGSR
ncbi:MAG: ABC-type transport auxiliary lipoprotein family protein [Luteimonas sp.]